MFVSLAVDHNASEIVRFWNRRNDKWLCACSTVMMSGIVNSVRQSTPPHFIQVSYVVKVTVNIAPAKTVTRPGIEKVTQNKTDTFQQNFVPSYKIT